MMLVHVYVHHNIVNPDSNLTLAASLDVLLDALSEFIMVLFLNSPALRTKIAVGLSDPYGPPSVSICGVPVHSIIAQEILYKNYNNQLLQ